MHITRVGFGSWAVGGGGWAFGWGPQDDGASLATTRYALEAIDLYQFHWPDEIGTRLEASWAAIGKPVPSGQPVASAHARSNH
jgi:aryl-alcohol dehydrogenase-like predicted oxidoreductase